MTSGEVGVMPPGKMNITLHQLVSHPIIVNNTLLGYEFVNALKKLGSDALPVKTRYAIARTLDEVEAWVRTYDEFRASKIKEKGELRSAVLEREGERILNQPHVEGITQRALDQLQATIKQIKGTPNDTLVLSPEHAAEIEQALAQERNQLVTLTFLEAPVKLPETTKLTAQEMRVLGPLIEV